MIDKTTDTALDERLSAADPLRTGSLPSEAETEAALRRLLATAIDTRQPRAAPRLRLAHPRLLGIITAGLAALGATVALVLGAAATSPAFAVTRNPDGTVTVRLMRFSAIADANRKLTQMGVRARLATAADTAAYVAKLHPCQGRPRGTVTIVTIDPAGIPKRQWLVIAFAQPTGAAAVHGSALERAEALARRARALAHSSRTRGDRNTVAAGRPTVGNGRLVRVYCGQVVSWVARRDN